MPRPKALLSIKKGDVEVKVYDKEMLPIVLKILGIEKESRKNVGEMKSNGEEG